MSYYQEKQDELKDDTANVESLTTKEPFNNYLNLLMASIPLYLLATWLEWIEFSASVIILLITALIILDIVIKLNNNIIISLRLDLYKQRQYILELETHRDEQIKELEYKLYEINEKLELN